MKGADYGWKLCEGRHDNPYRRGKVNCSGNTYTGPIHGYSHTTRCESITGGAFVPDRVWPASYDEAYLFGDFMCGKIFKLTRSPGAGFSQSKFTDVLGTARQRHDLGSLRHYSGPVLHNPRFQRGVGPGAPHRLHRRLTMPWSSRRRTASRTVGGATSG